MKRWTGWTIGALISVVLWCMIIGGTCAVNNGCNPVSSSSGWFSRPKIQAPEFPMPETEKKAMFVLSRADDLFFILILAAVGGLVFGFWARTAIGFYIAGACAAGAVSLLLLAQFSTYIGYGLIAIAGMAVIFLAVRWRKVADAAIDYADNLKQFIPEESKTYINGVAEKVQTSAVKKYILKRRNGNGNGNSKE